MSSKTAILLISVIALAGCATEEQTQEQISNKLQPATVTIDGRPLTCVVYNSFQEGGLSCDWDSWKIE